MTETMKYITRFALVIGISAWLMLIAGGAQALRIIAYKVSMASIGVGLAELVWAVYFKPVYGKTETMSDEEQKAVLMFRGILYAAIILALTLGL